MNLSKVSILLSASAIVLAACSQSSESMRVSSGLHRTIEARETNHALRISTTAYGSVSEDQRAELTGFIRTYREKGYGPISLSAPENGTGSRMSVNIVRSYLTRQGVQPEDIITSGYDGAASEDAPVMLAFKSYEAHVPGCSAVNEHNWSDLKSNTSLPSFGCAVNENIAMMIAHPGDVRGERPIDDPEATRQLNVLEKYRLGENTASAQTADGSSSSN